MRLAGYTTIEVAHETTASLVLHAERERDGVMVYLKTHLQSKPTRAQISQIKKEHEILRSLVGVPGVIACHGLEAENDRLLLVLQDCGGESLANALGRSTFTLGEAIEIGVKVCAALQEIHRQRIIHKDINPGNIIYNRQTGEVKLIDFHISSIIRREDVLSTTPYGLEGTLEYISPEQTGRMNRALDYRTDFYSLGATLYELLAGRRPFDSEDSLELVHSHLVKPPPPLPESVPGMVASIVMKLMAKTPERRYKSALGIQKDLERCRDHLGRGVSIPDFPIGQQDFSPELTIPQQLFGRAREIESFLAAFEQTCQGKKQILLVSGPSGIGKTSLIQEINRPLTQKRGYFVSGKFEQLQRAHPYLAFSQAFRELARQLLTEPEERIQAWKEALAAALGNNAAIIAELVPEISLLVGSTASLPEMSAQEKQNRFTRAFLSFLSVLARPEHPLALFIDDLQWADQASLELMEKLLAAPESTYLFFIGAYRDNEVDPAHALSRLLKRLAEQGIALSAMTLPPLRVEDINELLTKTLSCPGERSLELAQLIHKKTQGNPFFINEFVLSLAKDGLFVFDTGTLEWKWDLVQIQAKDITDNVIEFLSLSLKKLPTEAQRMLSLAACFGNRFQAALLGKLCGTGPREVLLGLKEAISTGYVIPLGQGYQSILLGAAEGEDLDLELKFSHDRIQQAAYQLNPQEELSRLHKKVGEALLELAFAENDESRIFDIVHHLNRARDLLQGQAEADTLARLNYRAGTRAKASSAYRSAHQFFRTGLELLGPDGWSRAHELSLSLHEEAAETACVCGLFEQMDELARAVNEHAREVLETVNVAETRIIAQIMQNNPLDAVRIGIEMLRRLGVRFSRNPSWPYILGMLLRIDWTMRDRTAERLLAQGAMTDPNHIAAMRILARLLPCALFTTPKLLLAVVTNMTLLSVKHGNHGASGPAYAAYGTIVCDGLGNVPKGHPFGECAIRLADRPESFAYKSETLYIASAFVKHWRAPLEDTLAPLLMAYQSGLESGDYEMAAYSLALYCMHMFLHGRELDRVTAEYAAYAKPLRALNSEVGMGFLTSLWQAALNFQGDAPEPWVLKGEVADEASVLSAFEAAHNNSLIATTLLSSGMLCLFFGKHEEGIARLDRAVELSDYTVGTFGGARIQCYSVLTRLFAWEQLPQRSRLGHWRRMLPSLLRIRRYARYAPENHLHLYYLVRAERSRIRKRSAEAMRFYQLAAETALKHGILHERALALERLARHLLVEEQPFLARSALDEAIAAYQRWGALAKVRSLTAEFEHLSAERRVKAPRRTTHTTSESRTTHPTTSFGTRASQLDMLSVIKASQTISQELVLDKLLKSLLEILVQNTGAETGFLLVPSEEGKLFLKTFTSIDEGARLSFVPGLLDDSDQLSPGVVRYVERTRKLVVLGDAANEGSFVQDPYVLKHRPRSVLCMPVCRSDELKSILYLENRETTDVFSAERVETVNVLVSQAAISIDNAKLYTELGQALTKARESEKLKTEFFAKITHELRTPLNSIINIPEYLRTRLFGAEAVLCDECKSVLQLDEGESLDSVPACPHCGTEGSMRSVRTSMFAGEDQELDEQLEVVRKSGLGLLTIVNDILDISKLETGKMELHKEPIELRSLVLEVMSLLSASSQLKHVSLVADDIPGETVLVADRMRFQQVLVNLLSNAIKFSPEDGRVRIGTRADPEQTLVWVRDYGIGIAKNDQALIFESFRQADGSHTRKYGGTGLGLAICRQIMDLHGGKIWVESEPGQGSTFYVNFPRCESDESDATSRRPTDEDAFQGRATAGPEESDPLRGGRSLQPADRLQPAGEEVQGAAGRRRPEGL